MIELHVVSIYKIYCSIKKRNQENITIELHVMSIQKKYDKFSIKSQFKEIM